MITALQVSLYLSNHHVGLRKVNVNDLQAGDVVVWMFDDGDPTFMYDFGRPGHPEPFASAKTATIVCVFKRGDVRSTYCRIFTVEYGELITSPIVEFEVINR